MHALMTKRMAGLDLPGPAREAARAARSFLAGLRLGPAGNTVLGHADPNLANYLWDGRRIRIVDFEDAGRSDREFELADLVEHLSARHADWTEFLTMFDLDGDRLLNARRLYAIFWLHTLRPGGPAEHRNPPGTLDQRGTRRTTRPGKGRLQRPARTSKKLQNLPRPGVPIYTSSVTRST
ncbi:phosphotransferase [Dactylosporangium sp. NPDC000244]|uniref:phosphotransferase family protein n=1 Tax=Dactylosporangium sp. NPDC000244 TaxID=3154365 RepID=UPI0033336114